MFNIEVGPGSATSVLEVGSSHPRPRTASWYFHANMYKHLVVEQQFDNSSYHREVRALQLQVRLVQGNMLGMAASALALSEQTDNSMQCLQYRNGGTMCVLTTP
eukprot:GHUV01037267.1.p3 GENE.GHUV01037267.1~~GHUV01037267.1.p3  ORF type:complete len:104 (+),score=38.64 GHUV01037267.1:173-484(+)